MLVQIDLAPSAWQAHELTSLRKVEILQMAAALQTVYSPTATTQSKVPQMMRSHLAGYGLYWAL